MVKDLIDKISTNETITTNYAFYKRMHEAQQKECEHASVILGTNFSTFIVDKDTGTRINPVYRKCLLCSKDLTYIDSCATEFDARKYVGEDLDYNDALDIYPEIKELFKNTLKSSDTEEEAFIVFQELLNEKNIKRIKSITDEK